MGCILDLVIINDEMITAHIVIIVYLFSPCIMEAGVRPPRSIGDHHAVSPAGQKGCHINGISVYLFCRGDTMVKGMFTSTLFNYIRKVDLFELCQGAKSVYGNVYSVVFIGGGGVSSILFSPCWCVLCFFICCYVGGMCVVCKFGVKCGPIIFWMCVHGKCCVVNL